jgi:DNA-binding SARP family transcriptional activator
VSSPEGADDHGPRAPELGYRQPVPYRAVFEFLPSGVVVTDAQGHLTGVNLTARRLLGDVLARERLRCCDLFGCRRAGTPLADHCFTELALERPEPLPEVRVDIASREGQPASFWVSAASIGDTGAAVIFQLRQGVVGDRRRRTEPHWMVGPRLRIFTLGRTRLESSEGPLAGEWLSHRPGEVLKFLVCQRSRTVPIDELLETLWPAGRAAPTNVRQAVHTLRDRLEPTRAKHGRSAFIAARKGGYELEAANLWIDADDFEANARSGLGAAQGGDVEIAEPALARAAALYRGDFLADEPYAEWVFAERDRLRDLAAQVLRAIATLKLAAEDLDAAGEHLQRLAELEPYDLDAQRELSVAPAAPRAPRGRAPALRGRPAAVPAGIR